MLTYSLEKAEISMLISDRANFRATKLIRITRHNCYIIIKRSVIQENIIILNVYVGNSRVLNYVRKSDRTTRRNRWIYNYSWKFNTPSLRMGQPSRQKLSKNIAKLSNTIRQLDVMDIYKLIHTTAEYIFFSSSHGTFAKVGYIVSHKIHLKNFERIQILHWLLLDHSRIKLDSVTEG